MPSVSRWTHGLLREVLPNGLTVLVQRDDSSPAASVVTHVRAGFFDEPDRWVGVSHVLEHMFFKGTPTRGVGAVARETKAAGGYLNAHTAYDHTAYFVVLPAARLSEALAIQSDALRHSLIDADELARELQVIIQEAKRKRDTPSAVTHETLHEVLFDRHRIRRWRIGTEEQLARYTRDDIHGYYRSRYVPERTIVAIAGNVDPDAVMALAREHYGDWERRPGAIDPSPDEPPRSGVRARTLRGDLAQAELSLGWRAVPPLHPDAAALDLAAAILSAGRGSWLYRSLRETGIVTSIAAHYYAPTDVGVFALGAELEPERVGDAVDGVAEAVTRLSLRGPSEEDLFRARTLLLARWARRMEPTEGRAIALASAEALDGVDFLDREYAALSTASAEDVRRAAGAWLHPDAVAGVAYLPTGRGHDLSTDALAAAFAVTPLTPLASPPRLGGGDAAPRALTPPIRRGRSAGVHHYDLPGADLLIRQKRGVPMVSLGVYFPSAPVDRRADAGIASLAVRSAVRGAGRLDAESLAFAFERLGGTLSPGVASDWIGYTTTVLAEHLPEAGRLLRTVVEEPTLAELEVARERQVLAQEAEQVADDMLRFPFQLAFAAAFDERGYGVPIGGFPDTVPELSTSGVRRWLEEATQGTRLTVIAVGDVEPDAAAEELARRFGDWRPSARSAVPAPQAWGGSHPIASQSRMKAQSAIAMLFPGPHRRSPARRAAEVWAAVASGLGGRLFEALRDRRSLAYTVIAMAWQRRGAGALATYIATSPEREEEARAQMLEELARFAREPIPEAERVRAVEYLAGQAEVRRQSGSALLSEILEAWMIGEGIAELEDPGTAFRAVTAQAVQAVAAESLDPARRVEGIVRGASPERDAGRAAEGGAR
ncbi:MAG TPA: pitrilysin family protein [Gemmatimonadales bacterium]|nr:pitrilysin family protein [Gemmatimonadales bacterium]